MPSNVDAVFVISSYLEPDPVIFSRLAMVSRDFYTVFTSDKLWRPLNCDGRENNFASVVNDTTLGDFEALREIKKHWASPKFPPKGFNPLAWLGYYCKTTAQPKVPVQAEMQPVPANLKNKAPTCVNYNLMQSAVQINGNALQHASLALRQNKSLALKAVSQCGNALSYLPIELRNDLDVVAVAATHNYVSCTWCTERPPHPLFWAGLAPRENFDILMSAVEVDPRALLYATPQLKCDRRLAKAAVSRSGTALGWVSEDLKQDRDLVITAIKNDPQAIKYARHFHSDKEILWLLLEQSTDLQLHFDADQSVDRISMKLGIDT